MDSNGKSGREAGFWPRMANSTVNTLNKVAMEYPRQNFGVKISRRFSGSHEIRCDL